MAKDDATQTIEKRLEERRNRRAEDHGDYVVVHDLISIRHPDDLSIRPQDQTPLQVARGERLPEGTFQADLEHHLKVGSVVAAGSEEAKLALAGMRPFGRPVGAIPLMGPGATEPEQVRAVQSAVPFAASPQEALGDLLQLDLPTLVTVAKAFGRPIAGDLKDLSKLDVAKQIVGIGVEGGEDESEVMKRRAKQTRLQAAASEATGTPEYVVHDDETRAKTLEGGAGTKAKKKETSAEKSAGGETGSGKQSESAGARTTGAPPHSRRRDREQRQT